MAKFITTTEISYQLETIIKQAKRFLIIVTPFIKVHHRLKKVIEEKLADSNLTLYVVCRENDIDEEHKRWLEGFKNIKCFFSPNLHAKCYLNEASAILTSMNLYQFSMVNNVEFGILIDRKSDDDIYYSLFKECNSLIPHKEQISLYLLDGNFTFKINWEDGEVPSA